MKYALSLLLLCALRAYGMDADPIQLFQTMQFNGRAWHVTLITSEAVSKDGHVRNGTFNLIAQDNLSPQAITLYATVRAGENGILKLLEDLREQPSWQKK